MKGFSLDTRLQVTITALDEYSDWDEMRWGDRIEEAVEVLRDCRASHAALVAALRPFAHLAEEVRPRIVRGETHAPCDMRIADLVAARAALAGVEGPQPKEGSDGHES